MSAQISDHALLRYLERVKGIEIEAIRAEMTVAGIDAAAAFGCDTVILGNGARLKLQGETVATVLPKRLGRRPRHG